MKEIQIITQLAILYSFFNFRFYLHTEGIPKSDVIATEAIPEYVVAGWCWQSALCPDLVVECIVSHAKTEAECIVSGFGGRVIVSQ